MVGVRKDREDSVRALKEHPDRFLGSVEVDPNEGMDGVRYLQEMVETYGIKAVTTFPAGVQVPINDKRYYPLYAKCVRARHPHLRVRRHPRAAGAVRPAAGRAHRRGLLRLPRAHLRDAPRRASRGPSWR